MEHRRSSTPILVEITAEVLDQVDASTGRPLVELIVDEAEQKGTGRWTVQSALELGVPVSAIAEAVFARSASGDRTVREAAAASSLVPSASGTWAAAERKQLVDDVRDALWSAKVVAYAQGLEQIRQASANYGWGVDIATVARIWRGGCIIRARLLKQISDEYAAGTRHPPRGPEHPGRTWPTARSRGDGSSRQPQRAGVPVPGFSSALAYYDTVRAERLPAALVQGLRDNFGAHTYRRVDREGTFHTLWSATGPSRSERRTRAASAPGRGVG